MNAVARMLFNLLLFITFFLNNMILLLNSF